VLHFDENTSISEDYLQRTCVGITEGEEAVELHLVGGYEDEKDTGRLVIENILCFFHCSRIRFNLITAMVGKSNTRVMETKGRRHNAPIFHGACLDLSTRKIHPATFADRSCDEP
jgi:hypothetical protein